MHLLVVSGFWPTGENPISGIFVAQQVAALTRLGCNVTIVVPTTIGGRPSHCLALPECGIDTARATLVPAPVLRLPELLSSFPGALALNTRLYGMLLAVAIRRLRRDRRFDGCIIHGVRYAGLSATCWRRDVDGKLIVVVHGVDPFLVREQNLLRARPLLERLALVVDGLVLVGRSLWAHAASLGLPFDKTVVIPNGTDVPPPAWVASRQRRNPAARRIVSVSNLLPFKGIDDNLRALARIAARRPDLVWTYRIIGDGKQRRELEHLTRALNLADRVRFIGRRPYEDTLREISDADIFSLPSWAEAFGIVYLEAMARMKPVIGCRNNGAADIITDHADGLLVPPHSVDDLAQALQGLLEDPDNCERLGLRARRTAERFTWDINSRRMLDLLGSAAATGSLIRA